MIFFAIFVGPTISSDDIQDAASEANIDRFTFDLYPGLARVLENFVLKSYNIGVSSVIYGDPVDSSVSNLYLYPPTSFFLKNVVLADHP